MTSLFYWDGKRPCGTLYAADQDALLPVEELLKRDGWEVILFSLALTRMQPMPGYEEAYAKWKAATQ